MVGVAQRSLSPEFGVCVGDFVGGAVFFDLAVIDEDGAVAEFANVFHGVGD